MNNASQGSRGELIPPVSLPASASISLVPAPTPGPAATLPEHSFEDYLRVLRRRWPIMVSVAVVLGLIGLGVSLRMPKQYQSTAEVYVQPPGTEQQGFGAAAEVAAIFQNSAGDISTQMERMQSDQAMDEVIQRLGLQKIKPEDMRKSYEIAPSKTANGMLNITATDGTRAGAVRRVNVLIDVYKNMMMRDDASTVGRTSAYLRHLIQIDRARVAEADQRLENYSLRNDGVVDPVADASQYAGQLMILRTTKTGLERDMQVAQTAMAVQQKNLATLPPTQVSAISFVKNPRIEADRTKISELVQQQAAAAKLYTPADDQMKQIQAQIDATKADMAAELVQPGVPGSDLGTLGNKDNPGDKYLVAGGTRALDPNREESRKSVLSLAAQLEADRTQDQALQNNIAQLDAKVLTGPEKLLQYKTLKSRDDLLNGVYQDLQIQYEHLQARRSAEQVYVQTIQAAQLAKKQSQPRPLLYSALAAFLGLLLGGLAMFLVDGFDPQVRDAVDVRRSLSIPVLASIRRLRAGGSNALMLDQLAAPSFRRLAYTLAFRGIGKGVRSLLVTSAVSGEGTTFTASQLALAFAREGKRVIIIDANTRNPSLHVLFGAKNNEGWVGLTRNGSHPEQALVPVTHGQTSHSPIRLIPSGSLEDHGMISADANAEKVGELIHSLQSEADIVLVDAPAVFEGIDTAVLADKVEGILYVAGVGRVTREEVDQATSLLGNCRAPLIGVVVNSM